MKALQWSQVGFFFLEALSWCFSQWNWNSQVQPHWLVKGLQPGNPGKGCVHREEVLLHKSVFHRLAFDSTASGARLSGNTPPPPPFSLLHCGGVSPTISMPCCWSCARSSAFSFFSSSICCLHSSLSTCILSTSLRLSCSRWLLCLSSRM